MKLSLLVLFVFLLGSALGFGGGYWISDSLWQARIRGAAEAHGLIEE